MLHFFLSSLRLRLLALVLLAAIPALGLILYSASEQRQLAIVEAEKNVLRLAHLAVDNQARLVEGTHQLMVALAQLPEVREGGAACHALLADLVAQYSFYTGLSAARPNGDIYCSSLPLDQPRNVADRPYIQQALQTGNFAASEYQVGRLTGKPVLSLAYPVLDQAGQIQAVLVAALDLAWLNQFAAEAQLPAGAAFILMDAHGTIMARYPDPEQWVGQSVQTTQLFQTILAQGEGTAEVAGVDGDSRLYAFKSLPALGTVKTENIPGAAVNAYVSVGIPTDIAFAELNRTLVRNLAALGLVAMLGLAAAWFGSEIFILRQVRLLLQTTRRLSAGDLTARIRLPHSSGDLNQLAQAFDHMAETLQQREAERNRVEETQRFLAEASLLLADSIDYETTLTNLARLATPHIADWCAVDILAEDETLQRLAVAHIDPAKVEWAHGLQRRFPYDPNAPSGVAQVLRTGRPEFYSEIPDELLVASAPDPETLHILREIGFTSVITIPMQARGHTLGAITLVSAESGRRYGPEDLALAEDLARRAAIAIDNARLYRSAQEEITQRKQVETRLAEEHRLLRTFIDNIPDAVYVKDTESRFLIANKMVANLMGTTPDQLIGQTDFDFYPEELAKQYYADEQAIITSGQALVNQEESRINHAGNQSWILTTKVPLYDSQGKIKGLVGISRNITGRKQMEQALQKAHAELEARVEQRTAELTRANEQLAALYKIGQIITAPLRLDVVLDLIVRNTAQLLATDSCVILLLDEAGETLAVKGAYGISEEAVKGTRDRVGESIAGRVVQTGQPIIANDLPHDPRFYNPAAANEGLLACASVPLVVGEKIIGTLDVHSKVKRRAFTDMHLQTLKLLASQAAIAVENARLYEAVQQARDELEERVRQRTAELVAANEQLQQEVAERKQQEEALQTSQTRLAGVIASTMDAVITLDARQYIILFNAAAEQMFRCSAAEVLGQPLDHLIPVRFRDAHRKHIRTFGRTKVSNRSMGALGVITGLRADGQEFPIEASISQVEAAGQKLYTVILRDITERKQTEEALRLSEERFAKAFRASPAALSITRLADGCFVDVNESFLRMFGYGRGELIGHRSTELNMFPNPDERAEPVRLLREQGWVRDYEMTLRTKSGELRNVLFSTEAIELDGKAHALAILFDITQRKQAEEQLKQALAELERSNAELQQFAYVASHDLQEPLRMVASYTQLLARRYKGKLDADADDFIAYAVDGANRMQRLINDLLTYSRVGTRGQPLALTEVETALDTALANLEMAVTENQAVVSHDPLPKVLADETQLSQLFQNLIGNALKFRSAEPPTVHVSTERRDHEWLFSVRDNGIGLEPQYAERIFVIFQRLHRPGDYPGTGIGLAICKRIVERHGGRIWVESQPDQGATFYFTLPVDGGKPYDKTA